MVTVSVPLTHGKVALIDEEDYPLVSQYKWSVNHWGYAQAHVKGGGNRTIVMHRLIMGFPPNEIDHINRNKLNNTRANLRHAHPHGNIGNRGPSRKNTSGYRGVHFFKRYSKWQAYIREESRRRHLGYFATPEEAARAYDAAAREVFGEFAYLNFPD